LSELNIGLIKLICENIGIKNKKFINSSEMNLEKNLKRTDKLIRILETIGAKLYITPEGSLDYLRVDNFTKETSIKIKPRNYIIKAYDQNGLKKFIPKLSILDLIANKGWKGSKQYIV